MLDKRILKIGLLFGGAWLALAPAAASTITDAWLYADCEGYTVYVEGFAFEETSSVPFDYRFELQALTPGVENVVVEGSLVVECDPFEVGEGRSTCDPFVSVSERWSDALGHPLSCGDYELITTDTGGCETIRSRYEWSNDFGSRCEKLFPTSDAPSGSYPEWTGLLSCPCEEGEEICRTPGFWGTHAAETRKGRKTTRNITQEVIDAALMSPMVCGQPIETTAVDRADSALEGMCVSPRGDQRLQLIRQLTAASLNCIMTNGNGDCFEVSVGATFADCNDACAMGWDEEYGSCIDALDCFNNGGVLLDNGFCQLGTCADDGSPCDSDESCGMTDSGEEVECLPLDGNCHDRPLVNEELGLDFDPPGPAGSPKECNQARRNRCTLLGGCRN
jgi:hypothetical protein